MKRAAALGLALASTAPPGAHGARPMVTDDARLADAGACQFETWVRRNDASTEYWAMPACNPWGGVELGFGAARTQAGAGGRFSDALLQAKTLLRPLREDSWGLAVTVGTYRHPVRVHDHRWPGDPYVNVPFSVSVLSDSWVAHVNAGAIRERDSGRTLGTWGFGHEVRLREDLFLTAEAFRADFGRPLYQVGLRHWVVRDRVQVDGSAGTRGGGSAREHGFTLGVHLQFPPFRP